MANEPALSIGATGEWVTYLHELLVYKQYGSGFTDGTFDGTTEAAVRYAQQCNSLTETGECDEATWAALAGEQDVSGAEIAADSGDGPDDPPDDIAISVADSVNMSDLAAMLEDLEDMPENVTAVT